MRELRQLRGSGLLAALLCLVVMPFAEPLHGQSRGRSRVPDHPSQLRFESRPFVVPEGERYRHVLPSGVVVYVAEDRSLPLVEIAIALRAGAWLDPPEKVGLAALTASMMRRGGAGELSPEAFDQQIDSLGARLRAVSGNVRSGAILDCASWVVDEGVARLFGMLRRPRFDPVVLRRAKKNLRQGLEHRNDDPVQVLGREWGRLIQGEDHFTTRDLTPATLAAIGPDDLAAFHRRAWRPEAMVVAVSGDVETEKILALLESHFAPWVAQLASASKATSEATGEAASETDTSWPPPAPNHQPKPGRYHLERDIPQAKVALGHLGAVRETWDSPEFFALTVMNELLGGGELVSRIGGRVRTVEGLAYGARSRFEVGDHWPGDFQVSLETANPTAHLAASLAIEEIERLRRRAPGAEELRRVKRSLTSVFPLLFDSASEIAGYFAEDELLGRPHRFWREYRANIETVTAEDVRRAAEQYLRPDRLLLLTAGRWAEIEAGDPRRKGAAAKPLTERIPGEVVFLPERDPLTLEAPSDR